MRKAPNSRVNLDKAIQRFAGDVARENELRNLMANAIVAQLIGAGVVKGGTGLKFRYGEDMSRATLDLDTAWRTGLDEFLRDLKSRLASGWCGFTGEVVVSRPASPRGVPFEYVMQPCDVKLSYLGRPWYTVQLEVGHNEIGDADGCDMVEVPGVLAELRVSCDSPSVADTCHEAGIPDCAETPRRERTIQQAGSRPDRPPADSGERRHRHGTRL